MAFNAYNTIVTTFPLKSPTGAIESFSLLKTAPNLRPDDTELLPYSTDDLITPIVDIPCQFHDFRGAPDHAQTQRELMRRWGEHPANLPSLPDLHHRRELWHMRYQEPRVIGRRVGNEVELFKEEFEEVQGFAEDGGLGAFRSKLEEMGLVVRMFVPEANERKFPRFGDGADSRSILRAGLGEVVNRLLRQGQEDGVRPRSGGGKTKLLDRCTETLEKLLAREEDEKQMMLHWGLIGDVSPTAPASKGAERKRVLAIARVNQNAYDAAVRGDMDTFVVKDALTQRPINIPLLGTIIDGTPDFSRTEDDLIKPFFDSLGRLPDSAYKYIDIVARDEAEEREAARAAKRAAKKQHRKDNRNAETSPSKTNADPDATTVAAKGETKQTRKRNAKRAREQAAKDELVARSLANSGLVSRAESHERQGHYTPPSEYSQQQYQSQYTHQPQYTYQPQYTQQHQPRQQTEQHPYQPMAYTPAKSVEDDTGSDRTHSPGKYEPRLLSSALPRGREVQGEVQREEPQEGECQVYIVTASTGGVFLELTPEGGTGETRVERRSSVVRLGMAEGEEVNEGALVVIT